MTNEENFRKLYEAETIFPMSISNWSIADWERHCDKLIKEARQDERAKIEQDIRQAWKHGDLREGNFENLMTQIFK